MTVSSTTNRKTFAGNGVTTSFATSPVVFFDTSDLVLTVVTDSTGASETLVENTDYTVSGGAGSTGTVSLAGGSSPYGAPAAGTTLVIRRVLPLTQDDDFLNNDINDAEVLEDNLDRLVMVDQQQSEEVGRALKVPSSEGEQDDIAVAGKAGYYLRRNVAGTAFELAVGDANTSTFTQSGTGAVERSVTAKLGEVVSVKDFGAVGDGITDDVAAFNLAAATGKSIFVPEGVYVLSTKWAISSVSPVILGDGKNASVLLFTGATDGMEFSGAYANPTLRGVELRTSNAAGGKAIYFSNKASGASHAAISEIEITYSGAGRWAFGLWAQNVQTSKVDSLRIYQSATIGIHLEYGCNMLNFYNTEVVGSSGAGTIQYGIEIQAASGTGGTVSFDSHFYGCTIQGYFTKALMVTTGCATKLNGLHGENTNAAPSDGADVVINGTSIDAHLEGCRPGSLLTAGTVRNLGITSSELGAVTIGAATICNLFNVRYVSLTQTAGCIVNLIGGDISGTYQNNFLQNTLLYYTAFPPQITDNSATPTLPGLQDLVLFNNSGATSVTSIAGGKTGQRLTVLFGNTNTTLVDGTNLRMAGNLVGAANTTISFISDGTNWYETSRSVN